MGINGAEVDKETSGFLTSFYSFYFTTNDEENDLIIIIQRRLANQGF